VGNIKTSPSRFVYRWYFLFPVFIGKTKEKVGDEPGLNPYFFRRDVLITLRDKTLRI